MASNGSAQHPASPRKAPAPTASATQAKLRTALFAFGVFIGLSGVWLLAPEVLRPGASGIDKPGSPASGAYETRALLAARIGAIRGDLWTQAAFAQSSLLWLDPAPALDQAKAAQLEQARPAVEAALAYSPINGKAWLLLASLPNAQPRDGGAAQLENAYLTAPNELGLAGLRLERAAASDALADRDVQDSVKSDIRKILAHQPHGKAAIIAAYRKALPQNRALFESLAADVDPAFTQSLRAGTAK